MENNRVNGRAANQLRTVKIEKNVQHCAEGSAWIEMGNTHILCTATVENTVPSFLRGAGKGWITAEYGMLPRSTAQRMKRESTAGKQGGRTVEIQRLIGRSLRAAVDLSLLGERQIILDCDVIRADGGTRTASITGAFVALTEAIGSLLRAGNLEKNPITSQVAAISAGIVHSNLLLDLDYSEDSACDSDINFVMATGFELIEIQGTAEGMRFSPTQLNDLMHLAQSGISQLWQYQQVALDEDAQYLPL